VALRGIVGTLTMRVFHTVHSFLGGFYFLIFIHTFFSECFSKISDIEGGHPLKWADAFLSLIKFLARPDDDETSQAHRSAPMYSYIRKNNK
jgi:hypothetical protein